MGDKRKLQAEIDRTLKKIDEGVDVYDRIYQKVVDAESQSNKEKYEVRALSARVMPQPLSRRLV
jgi:CCR4-NOT transcription complex subunit 3